MLLRGGVISISEVIDMALVDIIDLDRHAADHDYGLALVSVHTLAVARGVVAAALRADAPVVLVVAGDAFQDGLLPALEALAREAPAPVALLADGLSGAEQAVQAIRLGCNGLLLADGQEAGDEIRQLARSCGIPTLTAAGLAARCARIAAELEPAGLGESLQAASSWKAFEEGVCEAVAARMQEPFTRLGASGKSRAALAGCRRWRPVEHLIIYNTTTDDNASAELATEGRRVLGQIPGVRAIWSGRALTPDAGYQWCWLIRFAHPAVIASYRDHPDHVAYADHHFRPVAGDRISIDYELLGPEEG